MTCFSLANPAGLVAKYRLGNECEVWSETHFTMVTYAGDDGVVSTVHFMPTVFIPTTYIGYSPNGTTSAAQLLRPRPARRSPFPISTSTSRGSPGWSAGPPGRAPATTSANRSTSTTSSTGTRPAWARESRTSSSARICVSATGPSPSTGSPAAPAAIHGPLLPLQVDFGVRNDLQLRGIKPWESGEFQLGVQYIVDYSNHPVSLDDYGSPIGSVTHGGWGVTGQFVQKVLGGDNKLALQFGKGGGTGFGTLSRFYYPDFSLYFDPSEYRLRFVDVLTIQPVDWLGAQFDVIYQRDQNFLGVQGQNTNWYSAGGRVTWAFTEHAKLAGRDRLRPRHQEHQHGRARADQVHHRPHAHHGQRIHDPPGAARSSTPMRCGTPPPRAAGIDSGNIYTVHYSLLSGSIFGVQAETWY